MRSLLLCVVTCAWAAAAAELRCLHPQCIASNTSDDQYFSVEDHKIRIKYVKDNAVAVDCDEWQALESPAMPSFISEMRVPFVFLWSCPLPTAGSLADALAAMNVTLIQDGSTFGNLSLEMLPSMPPLAAHHFIGLERIVELRIDQTDGAPLAPTAGFLAGLRSLRSLDFTNVLLPADELTDPPPKLRSLILYEAGLEQLPKALLTLSDLETMVVVSETTALTAIFEVPPPVLRTLVLYSTNTTLQLNELPAIEEISLDEWSERLPTALVRCDELQTLELNGTEVEALPERWVAACPRLDALSVNSMQNLVSLPPKLLEGATSLTKLSFSYGVLETLPEGLLDGAPNLVELFLNANRLHTIASGIFLGSRALYRLDLTNNRLERSSLAALTPLTHLNWLGLSYNPHLGDLCDFNGYSPLSNLIQLRTLDLSETNITRICRDWRENMTFLWNLDLKKTNISQLQYADFQYTRDATVTGAQVRLDGAPVTSVRFTEDDYKRALTAPATGAWVRITSKLECDCRMYWTRLVAEHARHTLRVLPLRCTGNRKLSYQTADNVCLQTITPSETNAGAMSTTKTLPLAIRVLSLLLM